MDLQGKRVRIKAKGRIFEGIVMPSFTDCLVLKLKYIIFLINYITSNFIVS